MKTSAESAPESEEKRKNTQPTRKVKLTKAVKFYRVDVVVIVFVVVVVAAAAAAVDSYARHNGDRQFKVVSEQRVPNCGYCGWLPLIRPCSRVKKVGEPKAIEESRRRAINVISKHPISVTFSSHAKGITGLKVLRTATSCGIVYN